MCTVWTSAELFIVLQFVSKNSQQVSVLGHAYHADKQSVPFFGESKTQFIVLLIKTGKLVPHSTCCSIKLTVRLGWYN